MAPSLTTLTDEIPFNIEAIKTYIEVAQSEKDLLKKTADAASKATSQITTQLDKVKDLQKRYLKDPPKSMDNLLGFLDQTKGGGEETTRYLRKKILEAAAKIEPKVIEIVKEQSIKALGCSQEQTYQGTKPINLKLQPLPLMPESEGIYIPVQSLDFFSNLKNSPDTKIGKLYYEKDEPSADGRFKPYGGPISFPMNKQLYQLTETSNQNRSLSQINGENYLGSSGQNLFDIQYTTTNNFGVTGNYYRMLLIDREDGSGEVTNNVGQFLSDYYSTIRLVDSADFTSQLINIISGAINIKAQVGFGELQTQNRFYLIMQRILGLCFDDRREIDVSGVAKIAELDGVDDEFFELTEVDLRNIEVNITNVQNGVMEFEDCDNVKLPVDSEVLVNQLVSFRESEDSQTLEEKVSTIETIIDSISQNPLWGPNIPSNFNAAVAINKNIIKQIPLAIAAGVLSPKVLLPLYTLMSVVQSGATYTYNQAITSANTSIQSSNQVVGNAINVVESGVDFIKKYKTFAIEMISKINGEFLKVLYDELKRDILNLVASIILDISLSKNRKIYTIILRLVALALAIAQLLDDYRKCKSLMSSIVNLLGTINSAGRAIGINIPNFTKPDIPIPLLLLSKGLPGFSPERATINAIDLLQKLGMPTGTLPDGSPNLMLLYNLVSNKSVDRERASNEKVEIVITPGGVGFGKCI
jgi:hypothetical protein